MKSAVFLKSTIHNAPQNLLNGSSMSLHRSFITRLSHFHRITIALPLHVHLPYKYVLFTCKIRVKYVFTSCKRNVYHARRREKIAPKKTHYVFFLQNIWSYQKKVVILHAIYRILRRRFFDCTRLFTKYLHL